MDSAPRETGQIDFPRGRRMLAFVGTTATTSGLSDPTLQGRKMLVLRAYVNEDKFLLDATPPGAPPCEVRYVKVHTTKISIFSQLGGDDLFVRASLLAHNRDAAFAEAGLEVDNAWAIDGRCHPDVRTGMAFHDVPKLQTRLNETQAPGSPFQLAVGYFVFGDMPVDQIYEGTTYPAVYSSEPIVLLKDKRGQLIDVSPDIRTLQDRTLSCLLRKVFVEDPVLTMQQLSVGMVKMSKANEVGFLRAVSFEEHMSEERDDDAVTLGMVPKHMATVSTKPSGTVIHVFKDGGMNGYEKNKKMLSHFGHLATLRRENQMRGSVCCSRNLFLNVCGEPAPAASLLGMLVNASDFGNACFSCFMQLTPEESEFCGGCGKARYCSRMCQHLHWKEHRHTCAPQEERRARREAAALAKEKRAAELAKHDQMVALKNAEQAAIDAVRKHQAMVARAERADKEAREYASLQARKPAASSDAGQSHRGRNHKKKGTTQEQLVHTQWSSERERLVRQEAFNMRQEETHLRAEARKAQARVDEIKAKMAQVLKEQAAAAHSVPPRATLGEALEQAARVCV